MIGPTVSNQNSLQVKVKKSLDTQDAFQHSVRNLFLSNPLYETTIVQIFKLYFACVVYERHTCTVALCARRENDDVREYLDVRQEMLAARCRLHNGNFTEQPDFWTEKHSSVRGEGRNKYHMY